MNKNLVVEIFVPTSGGGPGAGVFGTGYPVANDLILTARHVVRPKKRDPDRPIEVRFKGGDWCDCTGTLIWESDSELDTALLKCDFPPDVRREVFGFLSAVRPEDHAPWSGAGFAGAGGKDKNEKHRLVSVHGTVYSAPDRDHQFELGVDDEAERKAGWQGISGSPVFVHGKIIGVIGVCPDNFAARRLRATPAWKLLEIPAFAKAVGHTDRLERRRRFEQQIAGILKESQDAIQALAKDLNPPVNLAGVEMLAQAEETARRLLDLDVPGVIKHCKRAHDALSALAQPDVARVVVDLLQLLLPAVYDHGVIEAVRTRKYNVDAALLELPAGIRTVAEVIMAAVDRRKTRYRSDKERFPEGTYSLPLPPEGGFDADGEAFRQAWHEHLANQFRPADADKLRHAWDDYLIGRFANLEPRSRQRDRKEHIEGAVDELKYRAEDLGKTYYFLTDAPAEEGARRALNALIRELKKDYPSVVFLQLNDARELERRERRDFRPLCDMLPTNDQEQP